MRRVGEKRSPYGEHKTSAAVEREPACYRWSVAARGVCKVTRYERRGSGEDGERRALNCDHREGCDAVVVSGAGP